jgi:hypothetical protein
MSMIAEVNLDEPDAYVGDGDAGWYLAWELGEDGKWYWSAVIDVTGNFIDGDLHVDHGPIDSELDAAIQAIGQAMDWCCENDTETADFDHCLPDRLRAQYRALTKEDADD